MDEESQPEVIHGDKPFKMPDPVPTGGPEPKELTPEDHAALEATEKAKTLDDHEIDAKMAAKDATAHAQAPDAPPKPNTPVTPHDGPTYVGKITCHSTSIDTGEAISFPVELPTPQTEEGVFRAFKFYQPSASREAFVIDPENKTANNLRMATEVAGH